MNTYLFYMPVKIYQKQGILKELWEYIKPYGDSTAIVVDPFFSSLPVMEEVRKQLKEHQIEFKEYNDVSSNPHNTSIDAIAADVKKKGLKTVVAIGGGSAIDTGKAVALLAVHEGGSWDFTERTGEEVKRPDHGVLPIIVVPTTSGTGSEATPYSVVNNPSLHLKATIVNALIYPDIALLDADLMKSMPPHLTALTGIDVFAHCIEAYTSNVTCSFTDMTAREGMRLFAENIRKAVKEPDNIEARENMAIASMYGGMAISRSGTTVPHAIGQALGGIYNAPHGGALAAVLPSVVKWTLPMCAERFAEVAEILDEKVKDKTVAEKAEALPDILEKLWKEILGEKVSCSTYGMTEGGITVVADAVMKCYYGDCKNYPKIPSRDDIIGMIADAK